MKIKDPLHDGRHDFSFLNYLTFRVENGYKLLIKFVLTL